MTENIHTAINKIMQEVGYVQKTGKVSGYGANYSYAGEAALIEAIRPSMVTNGVYMHVSKVIDVSREPYTTAKGTNMVNTIIQAMVTFTHAPSATSIETFSCGEGSDSGDKSSNKAMTGLYKYAMRQTFCIETGDDPDKQPSEEQERKQTERKPETKPASKPAAKVEKPKEIIKTDIILELEKELGMTVETANAIKNSKNKAYADMTSKELSDMSIGIGKALNKDEITFDRKNELEQKQAAIKLLTTYRAGLQ